MALLERFERFLDQVIPPPDDVATAVRRGEALLAAGDPEGALRLASTAAVAAPGFLGALALRADSLAMLGQTAEALALLDTAASVRALPAGFLARMTEYAALLGDDWRALDLEAQARGRLRAPDRAVALRLLAGARALLDRGALPGGLRLARGATLADPTVGGAWLLLGRDALARGDVALGRRAFERAVESLDPGDAGSNRLAGELAWGLNDLKAAVRYFRRAWIVGDESAIAPLVRVLSDGDDPAALEHVLADAQGDLAHIARALVGFSRGDAQAREALKTVGGATIPDWFWKWSLDVALQVDPRLAARWAEEARDRPGAAAVLSISAAQRALDAGEPDAARRAIGLALTDPTTRGAALTLLRAIHETAWSGRLGPLLEELASVVRDAVPDADDALERFLRARRRELDEPLRVVLLGEFSAGKSTFLNALVGAEVSPMGVLPTTAQVHWLRQGDLAARVVDLSGSVVETTVDEAPRVAARKRAGGQGVDYVEITLPLPRLGRLEVIDTPGFNAGDPEHELAVRRALDLADVGIWLFDSRQAGKSSEVAALAEAAARGLPVLGVLNKIDQASKAERTVLMDHVRTHFGDTAPCVLAVSARQALLATRRLMDPSDAIRAAAATDLADSGWIDLMRYFDENLVGRRILWKQARIAARSRASVREALDRVIQTADRARERADLRGALFDAVASLRETLLAAGATARREVSVALRDQLRGLQQERTTDIETLTVDAVAELGFRVRGRALEVLQPRLAEVERLGVAVGLVPEACSRLLTAPVTQYLDGVVAEGVRDAQVPSAAKGVGPGDTLQGAPEAYSFALSDPLAALDAVVDRFERGRDEPADALRVALEVALQELARFQPPAVAPARIVEPRGEPQ